MSSEPGTLSSATTNDAVNGAFPSLSKEEDELVEQDVRDRFKRMCEGYFDNVAKKLVIEHKVCVEGLPFFTLSTSAAAIARPGSQEP
jgi:hypothetical protein